MVQSRQVWRKVSEINIELKSYNYILTNGLDSHFLLKNWKILPHKKNA